MSVLQMIEQEVKGHQPNLLLEFPEKAGVAPARLDGLAEPHPATRACAHDGHAHLPAEPGQDLEVDCIGAPPERPEHQLATHAAEGAGIAGQPVEPPVGEPALPALRRKVEVLEPPQSHGDVPEPAPQAVGRLFLVGHSKTCSMSSISSFTSIRPSWPDGLTASRYMVTSLGQATTK